MTLLKKNLLIKSSKISTDKGTLSHNETTNNHIKKQTTVDRNQMKQLKNKYIVFV